jgi:hypothetical protein
MWANRNFTELAKFTIRTRAQINSYLISFRGFTFKDPRNLQTEEKGKKKKRKNTELEYIS